MLLHGAEEVEVRGEDGRRKEYSISVMRYGGGRGREGEGGKRGRGRGGEVEREGEGGREGGWKGEFDVTI